MSKATNHSGQGFKKKETSECQIISCLFIDLRVMSELKYFKRKSSNSVFRTIEDADHLRSWWRCMVMLLMDKFLMFLSSGLFGYLRLVRSGDVGLRWQCLVLLRNIGLLEVRALRDSDVLFVFHSISRLLKLLDLLELLRLSVVLILVAKVELPVVERDRLGQVGQLRVDDWAWCVHVQLAATVGRNAQVRVRQVWDGSSVQLDHLGKERRLG